MNEHIDLSFAGAKMAARNNEVASTALHGISAMYNIAQMSRYRVMYNVHSRTVCIYEWRRWRF